ncbi:hypothetical protein Aau02nite_40420 [Amorphoplanes auranticolor]|uniref:Uncharacterized protein n=2 Tax=Actinoplanes auranticolor TaxID=47988 RepID=A0A919SEJ7_9ACTN|nr:hypothetical protein Aau02nite_40420 [Actinoplanes auranticolor]
MVVYGLLRVVDGLDGDRHNGPAWDVGHVAFFAAIVLFAVLAVALRGLDRPAATAPRVLVEAATVATLFGAVCFLWVITGDLSADFRSAAPLPDALELIGPALFQIGLLILLVRLVLARRLPVWSPVLVLVGFAAIGVNLDLLPLGAVLVLVALLPLALSRDERLTTGQHRPVGS